MQIEVIDDCSTTDDPEAIVRDIGKDRVAFYRQPKNVGHHENFTTCLRRARGEYIHLLHGDDCVRDGFYRKMQAAFAARPEIGAAFCRAIYMDGHSHWQGFTALEQPVSGLLVNGLEKIAGEQRIMTPGIVVRRSVYETLGGFDRRLICCEDWEMWVRIAARYPVWYEPEPLAVYRLHNQSNTGRHVRNGDERRYNRMAIEMFKAYLPPAIAYTVCKKARETYALGALDTAYALAAVRDIRAMAIQIRECFKLRCSFAVITRLIWIAIKIMIMWGKQMCGKTDSIKRAPEVIR
jgi:glycosyltransferase involved in cell wall biosynthesis